MVHSCTELVFEKVMVHKGEFFLKGYSTKNNIEFVFNGHKINLIQNSENVEKLHQLTEDIAMASETSSLKIDGSADVDGLLDTAFDIKNLLSIAIGRRVTFDRHMFWTGQTSNLVERPMSKNENAGVQIVPDFEITNYLTTTLPNWIKLEKAQKDDIFRITDYLNQTEYDFIEDRILRAVQAWECSARIWTQETKLTDELLDLKRKIKKVYSSWMTEKEYIDTNGELGTRLTSSLDQEKLMIRLDGLVRDSHLNTDKIKLDLRVLKNLRDQVAHTGRIGIEGSEAIKYLRPAVIGLQLIILRRLGFDGKVYGEKDGWRTINDVRDYFL